MKLKSVYFYQAVKIGTKMINSANEKDFEISFEDGLAYIHDAKQEITVAVPQTNIPQMQLQTYGPSKESKEKVYDNLAKARAAKVQKALEV